MCAYVSVWCFFRVGPRVPRSVASFGEADELAFQFHLVQTRPFASGAFIGNQSVPPLVWGPLPKCPGQFLQNARYPVGVPFILEKHGLLHFPFSEPVSTSHQQIDQGSRTSLIHLKWDPQNLAGSRRILWLRFLFVSLFVSNISCFVGLVVPL